MKDLIKRILKEETQGLESFMDVLIKKFPEVKEYSDTIVKFIEESDCKNIEFAKFKMPALGLALHDGVLINEVVFYQGLPYTLFVIFHEIAHQYQFKKYGAELMYECYNNDYDIKKASQFMKKTEMVADEFALRKLKRMENMGLIKIERFPTSYYKNVSESQLEHMIISIRTQLKSQNKSTPNEISEHFYNMVKSEL